MGLAHLVLLFCLVCVASSANKLWLEDCEIQCILAADRYTDLWSRYSKYGDMQRVSSSHDSWRILTPNRF